MTENTEQFLLYPQEELHGESVYRFIHKEDRNKFRGFLNKQLLNHNSSANSQGSNQPTTSHMEQSPSGSSNFNCRLLIKPPSDLTVEEEQTRAKQYETLQVMRTYIRKWFNIHSVYQLYFGY